MTVSLTVPRIETARLRLRAPSISDIGPLSEFYGSDRAKFVGGPLTTELTWRVLATEIGHWPMRGFGRWAVEERTTGALVGIVGLWFPEGFPENELGWDLMNGHEGKGYATEAAEAARAYAYENLGWTTLISLVADGNVGSARVAERLGALPDGRFTHVRFGEMTIWRHPGPEEL